MARPRCIGIVACSAEGASLCYRTICAEGAKLFGPHAHPDVALHSLSLADYVAYLEAGDWPSVADLMLVSAEKLAKAGAEFLICPDNTIHQAMPLVFPRSSLPWLHIAEIVAEEAAERGFRKLGVVGTKWLVDGPVYPEKLASRGLSYVLPSPDERDEINRIIMDELVYGIFKPEAVASHQRVFARMKTEGCDAVVLGCTEIPLIMSDANSPLPTLDSTRLLARAALREAARPFSPRSGRRGPSEARPDEGRH
jgi:aspartate racemase